MPNFIRAVDTQQSSTEWEALHREHLALLAAAEQDLETRKFKIGGWAKRLTSARFSLARWVTNATRTE